MSKKLEELLQIQKQIESDKIAQAKLQGKIDSLQEKLFEQFPRCSSIKEVEKNLFRKQEEIEDKEKRLEEETRQFVSSFKGLSDV